MVYIYILNLSVCDIDYTHVHIVIKKFKEPKLIIWVFTFFLQGTSLLPL